jgi:hypothetical protein
MLDYELCMGNLKLFYEYLAVHTRTGMRGPIICEKEEETWRLLGIKKA